MNVKNHFLLPPKGLNYFPYSIRLVAMGNHCGKNELFFDQTKPF
jgi:hypothetical protein